MVLVMIVGVGEDRPVLFEKAVRHSRPPAQVVVAFSLQLCMSGGKLAAVAEPADVRKIGRRLLHSGHARVIYQRERGAVFAEHGHQVRAEPAAVAHLDGVAEALRQVGQEVLQYPMPSTAKEGGSCRRSGPSRSPSSPIVRTKFSASSLEST